MYLCPFAFLGVPCAVPYPLQYEVGRFVRAVDGCIYATIYAQRAVDGFAIEPYEHQLLSVLALYHVPNRTPLETTPVRFGIVC